jgi:hypothetical protein
VAILQKAEHIGLSAISLGELLSGFTLGGRFQPMISGSLQFVSSMV